jgi:DNA ligase-1
MIPDALQTPSRQRHDQSGTAQSEKPAIEPMLAQTFRGKLSSGTLFSQPKLDGVRCLANARGLWSRTGRRIASCRHIEEVLQPFFASHPDALLDGELYTHAFRDDLNAIISLVNTRKPDLTTRDRCESLIEFHAFDIPSDPGIFSTRRAALASSLRTTVPLDNAVRLVATTRVEHRDHLDDLFLAYRAAGYEGQMIRLDAPYAPTRSARLLKRKPFEDAEFAVVRIDEVRGSHSGYAKRVILALPDGRTFGAAIRGSREFARGLLTRTFQSSTVRFSKRTPSGIPRDPISVAFHEEVRL